jgi:phage terminase Nu1 subunit (DNA packaging protein)
MAGMGWPTALWQDPEYVEAMARRNEKPSGRIGIAELAAQLTLHEDSIRRHLRRGAPHQKRAGKLSFDLAEYRAWMAQERLTGAKHVAPDTPDLAAQKLAKLTQEVRIKRAQADRDERKAEVDRGTHQDLEHLREMLTSLGTVLRNGVDRMQRRFGPEAAVLFNGILDEFEQMVQKHVSGLGSAGGSGPSQAAP